MASGVLAVAAGLLGLPLLADALFVTACAGWVALALILAPRLLEEPRPHPRLESFALVAATAVLGTRLAQMGETRAALLSWAIAVVAWLALLAGRPHRGAPGGGWLLVVVGTESLAVLAAILARTWGTTFLDAGLGWWLLGLCLYPAVVFMLAEELHRGLRFAPPDWIAMGALAIATVAGTELLLAARSLDALASLRPLLRDADLVLWALASAWVVPLAVIDLRNRAAWRDPGGRWSFVFPLGMYAVAWRLLARAAPLPPLSAVAWVFFSVALLAWALTLLGHVRDVIVSA
jgi:tellurite resistance protein TehA-like permease